MSNLEIRFGDCRDLSDHGGMIRKKNPAYDGKPIAELADQIEKRRRSLAKKVERQAKRTLQQAEAAGVKVTEWENEFLSGITERLNSFGRAFADPEKGDTSMPLSYKQAFKMVEIKRIVKKKSRQSS